MRQKDLAVQLGISSAMVSKLAKRGMPTDTLERAQRWRKRHLELARVKGARPSAAQAPESAPDSSGDDEMPGDEDTSADYRLARAQREQIRAKREQIELDRLSGKLIDADTAAEMHFTASRLVRDRVQQVSIQAAPKVFQAVKTGGSIDDVMRILDQELRDALISAADAVEQIQLEMDEEESGNG